MNVKREGDSYVAEEDGKVERSYAVEVSGRRFDVKVIGEAPTETNFSYVRNGEQGATVSQAYFEIWANLVDVGSFAAARPVLNREKLRQVLLNLFSNAIPGITFNPADVFAGVPKDQLVAVVEGMVEGVVVTDPAGRIVLSNAALREMFSPKTNIVTIENPIEYQLKNINQVEINEKQVVVPAATRYEIPGGVTQTSTERRIMFSPEIPGHRVGEARSEWRAGGPPSKRGALAYG